MFRSLYARLAAALLGLFLLFGAFHVVSTFLTTRLYLQEVDQRVNWTLAVNLSSEEILMTNGRINQRALERIFHMLMVINPSIEIYLLDPSGRILAFSAPPGTVKRDHVALAPIRRFLAVKDRLPILGDDPRDTRRQKAFSVAALPRRPGAPPKATEGFLYVILGGEQYESAAALLRGSYVLKQSARAGVVALFLTTVAGLGIFRLLTRRLRNLTGTVDRFARSGLSERSLDLEASPGSDEIDQLAAAFRLMADRIGAQVRELKQTDALRRELVANVSHDLRTPLAALRGYLDTLLLKEDALSPSERRDYLETAARHSESLGKLVSELFELATLDSRQTLLEMEPFSLAELVQDVVQKFRLAAEKKGVTLTAEPPGDLSFARGDIGLVERVLENLLDNALRYTPQGGEVDVRLLSENDFLSVTVADTGSGIRAEDLPRVFERFYRAPARESGTKGGAGLGLAIAHRIIDLHGGRIEAESLSGAGSRFRFWLPSATGSAHPGTLESRPA
ncbi:MAG: HAMP domain-containing histidine kinase [Acidobacteria bacterium]|nr:HAMP domain-containing histidine kinase [Acidobacteriota bacterium]MCA1610942.1 HAMP domain-containing histidine kinase [Acidobacteriota bacterium]